MMSCPGGILRLHSKVGIQSAIGKVVYPLQTESTAVAAARAGAIEELIARQPYALRVVAKRFATSWLSMLVPLVTTSCEEIARGTLTTGLLDTIRDRFDTVLRGSLIAFLRDLTKNYGAESVGRLPPVTTLDTDGRPMDAVMQAADQGCQLFYHALQAAPRPTLFDMRLLVREPFVRYHLEVGVAPLTPGYCSLEEAIRSEVGGGQSTSWLASSWDRFDHGWGGWLVG